MFISFHKSRFHQTLKIGTHSETTKTTNRAPQKHLLPFDYNKPLELYRDRCSGEWSSRSEK